MMLKVRGHEIYGNCHTVRQIHHRTHRHDVGLPNARDAMGRSGSFG